IVLANVLGGVGFGYLYVFIGAYLPQVGVGAEVVGLLFGAQGVSIVLSAIPLGIYSDRRGRKGLLLIASVILTPSVLVFAFTTDAFGFLMPIAFYLLLRGYRESVRPREARPRTMDWRPLLKFSGINGLIGLGAGFFIPLVATWMLLKFAVQDTWSGPLLALANVTIGIAAIGSPPLAKRYGPVRAIVMAQGLSTAFMLSLAFTTNAVLAGGLYLVRAALMNMSA